MTKITIEIDTADPSGLSAAYKVLNALKAEAAAPAAPNAAPTPPASPTATVAAVPAPAPAPPAPTASASPSSPPPPVNAAPAPAPAPAPPPPAAAASGVTHQAFAAAVTAFAQKYTAKAAKARFAEMSTAFGANPAWAKGTDIPADKLEAALPWFNV